VVKITLDLCSIIQNEGVGNKCGVWNNRNNYPSSIWALLWELLSVALNETVYYSLQ